MSRYLADRGCWVTGVDLSPGMVAVARRDHPDLVARVASIAALPFPDDHFDGLLYGYSIIHTPDGDLPAVFVEAHRVLRPGGHVLVAFQAGAGVRDVASAYRNLGHDVTLHRFHRSADEVGEMMRHARLVEVARLVRRPTEGERDDQAVLIARAGHDVS